MYLFGGCVYNPLDKSMIDLHTYVTPTSYISIPPPLSSSYLVLHTPLPPITLFLLFAQPFQPSSVPGLDWSSPFIYPLPCTGISSVRHLFVLILRPPLLIFSSTHPRIILFSILPCARPLNRNESRDRKSTRLNSSHSGESRMPSSA